MRVFTVLGPTQSGKTTLTEALSGLEAPPLSARVSGGVGLHDFGYLGDRWCAIDIPGGADFLGTAGQALAASDAAVLVVPPEPEAAVLAAPYLRLIESAGVPCLLFVNRMDTAQARVRDIVAALQTYSGAPIVLRQIPIRGADGQVTGSVDLISERAFRYREGARSALIEIPPEARDREHEAREELLESLSEFDDHLLEQLIEDKLPPPDEVFALEAQTLQGHATVPTFLGAASHGNGVERLMKALRHDVAGVEGVVARLGAGDALALGFAADIRLHLGELLVLRALKDGLKSGAALGGGGIGNLSRIDCKTAAGDLSAGEVAVAIKSSHLTAGALLDAAGATPLPGWSRGVRPGHVRIVEPETERDDTRLSSALTRLAAADPGMLLSQEDGTGRAVVHLQGPMHMRRLLARLDEDFGLAMQDRPLTPTYRETISKPVDKTWRHRKQSGGAGQFADVGLTVRPQPRGAGFAFDQTVKGGAVPRNYIPAVEAGAAEAMEQGPLGFPVIDVAVTLTDGKHHSVDSSDFAFRIAAKNGVRAALHEAAPVLLQPIDRVAIHVPSVFSGALVPLISQLRGQVLGFDEEDGAMGWSVFRALLPASALDDLFQSLGGATQGTAWFETDFDHYEEVYGKEAEKVSQAMAEAAG